MKLGSGVIIYRLVFTCRCTPRAKRANKDYLSFDKEDPDRNTTRFPMQNTFQRQQK